MEFASLATQVSLHIAFWLPRSDSHELTSGLWFLSLLYVTAYVSGPHEQAISSPQPQNHFGNLNLWTLG